MAEFPDSVKNFLSLQNGVDKVVAAHPNDRAGEITAIETLIGAFGSAQSFTATIKDSLLKYRRDCKLVFNSVAQSTIEIGEIAIPDASNNLRLRKITSPLTVTWADIDTGVEANDTYYVYVVADTGGTGFTVLISLDNTTPAGATFFRRIGSFVNSSGDIQEKSIFNDDRSTKLGSWGSESFATSILALTDGFVTAYAEGNPAGELSIEGLTDGSNPPTTIRVKSRIQGLNDTHFISITMPVKKGDFWKVNKIGESSSAIFWVPLS